MHLSGTTFKKRASLKLLTILALAASLTPPAEALSFNIAWDPSVSSAPTGFKSAFMDAVDYYQTTFSNPVTIDLRVGWGEVNNHSLATTQALAASSSSISLYTYQQVYNALGGPFSYASLPTANPAPGHYITVNYADAKALNLTNSVLNVNNVAGEDGAVGFSSSAPWSFTAGQPQAGTYEFIASAEHEISEVMGRDSALVLGCTPSTCHESVLDLYRYTAPGILDRSGTSGNGAYFSVNGGVTSINTFDTTATGSLNDWANSPGDPFNHSGTPGLSRQISAGDLQVMQSLGYNLAPVPEPSEDLLMITGLGVLLIRRRLTPSRPAAL